MTAPYWKPSTPSHFEKLASSGNASPFLRRPSSSKTIAPALDELAAEFAGKVTIAKLNIDDNPLTPTKFGVRGIPTLMLFKNGTVAATKIGALPRKALHDWLAQNLA